MMMADNPELSRTHDVRPGVGNGPTDGTAARNTVTKKCALGHQILLCLDQNVLRFQTSETRRMAQPHPRDHLPSRKNARG